LPWHLFAVHLLTPSARFLGIFIKSLALIVTQNAIKVSSYAG
jgi:hypoxanthine-guanine phosphoribosyltransferase